jgi:predicted nucleic acid-binding Zn ribbon protein
MITNREIALSIIRGRKFYDELLPIIENGVVTKSALDLICEKHHIHLHTLNCFLFSGILVAQHMSNFPGHSDAVHTFEPDCFYKVQFTKPVDDTLCFYTSSLNTFLNRIEAYERFCRINQQAAPKHCKRCDLVIPAQDSGEFCGEKCKDLHEKQAINSTNKTANLEAAFEQLFRSIRDFFTIS